ncbi:MAG: glycerol-3-phosphate dehydrogenase [Chitinophagia bacterium]|nr:glycerol-3-phosphate dehydrogenase [Chitinophagia bacterium]
MEQKRIGIIGSGSWATAIAKIVTENGHHITWCLRQQSNIDYFEKRKHNPHYLRNAYFDLQKISFSTDIKMVVAASDIIIVAVPSIHIETTLASLEAVDLEHKLIVSAVKGVLPVHNILLNDWLAQKFNFPLSSYFTLLGPSHAEEVAAEQLSYLTFSGLDETTTTIIASYFKSEYINTIVNKDVIGVQYAGVAKNIYALGAGIAHGLEYGDNFLSVFIANCANEMQVLLKEIAKKQLNDASNMNHNASVYLGDLLVTCYSLHSRNRTFGNMIGKGYSVRAAELELNMVAEGYNASKCIHTMNQTLKVKMPIMDAVYQILWEGASPDLTFKNLEQILV